MFKKILFIFVITAVCFVQNDQVLANANGKEPKVDDF